jgi:hypothetical protein
MKQDLSPFDISLGRRISLKESDSSLLSSLGIGSIDEIAEGPTPLPDRFSLNDEMTPVKDQGSLSTCVAFTCAALLEHHHRVDISEGQIAHEVETSYDNCLNDGMTLASGMKFCLLPGAIEESLWPYDTAQLCWITPPIIDDTVQRFTFASISTVYTVPRYEIISNEILRHKTTAAIPITDFGKSARIKRHLVYRRRPLAISVPVFWESGWRSGPTILLPTNEMQDAFMRFPNPTSDGWHAIALCGYDDSTFRFTFKNSWSSTWGSSGYGTLPYQYIERFSDICMAGSF